MQIVVVHREGALLHPSGRHQEVLHQVVNQEVAQ
jgi:hypothetical protein